MKFSRIIVALIPCLLLPSLTYGAPSSYTVSPFVIDKEVQQRDIFSETITITNNKPYKVNIYASVNAIELDGAGTISQFVPPSVADGTQTITSWIAITRGRIEVMPGQTKSIPIDFKIHPDAQAGVYHALVGFGEGNNRPTAEKKAKSGLAPGVIVTLSVDQKKSEFLKLSSFAVNKFITQSENNGITYTLSNPGSSDVAPSGEIILYDALGVEITSIPVNPDAETLAPGQQTTFTVDAPVEGMVGKYKAFLSVDYGTKQLASVYDTAFFYVVPWQKLLLVFLTVLLFAIFATILLHRRFGSHGHDDFDELPLFVGHTEREDMHHDINLKQ